MELVKKMKIPLSYFLARAYDRKCCAKKSDEAPLYNNFIMTALNFVNNYTNLKENPCP